MKREQLIYYAYKYQGNYYRILKAIKNREPYQFLDIRAFTILDSFYPSEFKDLKEPPLVIFYEGDLDLLRGEKVAVVGSRMCCDYAKEMTAKLVSTILKDKVVVSGLAKGVDYHAHINANKTIGILGCGLDYIYPRENKDLILKMKQQQLVLSEYPQMTLPQKYHFPFRNRLIAALGKSLYVMQADLRSGTMTSVNQALELGKQIYALPYNANLIYGRGCNQLIEEGADVCLF